MIDKHIKYNFQITDFISKDQISFHNDQDCLHAKNYYKKNKTREMYLQHK